MIKALVRKSLEYPIFANLLMISCILGGSVAYYKMQREVYPSSTGNVIVINIEYPNALPFEVEEGVCIKVEQALDSVKGIYLLTAQAYEGFAEFRASVRFSEDINDVMEKVRSQIARINDFPSGVEKP
ncbi:MAG: efflux RND transporter permease subunit, partial [Simkania sp.]|nr:efflux RND transporter permease subunit [Simkania sp.]